MSAARIESKAYSDARVLALAEAAGYSVDECIGRLARLWIYCTDQECYTAPAKLVAAILRVPAETFVGLDLGEWNGPDSVRVKGTKGRIEWLGNKRRASEAGGRATKAKHGPSKAERGPDEGQAEATEGPNRGPLTLSLSLSPDPTNSDLPQTPSRGLARGRPRKPKPDEPTAAELESVSRVLGKITERTGIAYRGSKEHTRLIVARMRDGASEMDLRKVIQYCAVELGWLDKPEMRAFLRPETLFGPKTIARYLDAAISWHAKEFGTTPQQEPLVSTSDSEPYSLDAAFDEPDWMTP